MTLVTWAPESIRDVESIRAFITQDSPAYAELVTRRIVAAVEPFGSFPNLAGSYRNAKIQKSARSLSPRTESSTDDVLERWKSRLCSEGLGTFLKPSE